MQGSLPPEAQEKLETLQELQETAQNVAEQKQSTETALTEAKTALDTLEDVEADAMMYREVGELLIETEFDTAQSDLEDKVDSLEIRAEQLNKQEERVRSRFEDLQQELQQLLQGGAGGPAGPTGPGGAGGA
ncbi:MAG: prefoldin subunit beta [Halobacteriota archaeon]